MFLFSLSEELVALTTRFTDELMNQGLTKRILMLVSEINVTREFERLQKERGLGNEKHRKEVRVHPVCPIIRMFSNCNEAFLSNMHASENNTFCQFLLLQVSDLIKESRQALTDSLFSWTCQSPLSKDDTLALIGHLETVSAQADGSLDGVNLSLVMALLYCLDVSFIEQGTEDREGETVPHDALKQRPTSSVFESSLNVLPPCPRRSSSGSAASDGTTVCVCGAQSSDGQSAVEASWTASRVSSGLGFIPQGPLSASTRTG